MNGEFVVREARAADAEGVVRAHEAAWDAALASIAEKQLEELAPFAERVNLFRTSIDKVSDAARIWVAERSGEIVGMAVAVRESPETVELRDLYVAPAAWGSGVAESLMQAAIESVGFGAEEAFLWVVEENRRARRFYEREGWRLGDGSRASALGPAEVRYRRELGGASW